jgi:peptidoglycan/xylan/chitin deacetylase (PgdA/CDA1 family)
MEEDHVTGYVVVRISLNNRRGYILDYAEKGSPSFGEILRRETFSSREPIQRNSRTGHSSQYTLVLRQGTMAAWLPILTFHSIDDKRSVISVRPKVFQNGMARLYESGYQTLTLLETVSCLRSHAPFPDRSLAVTFDDGFQSVYKEAFPVLQDYGMSATVFLTVGERAWAKPAARLPSRESRPMLSWAEIHEMHKKGITFGAHTLTHPDLTRLSPERIETEVGISKAVIEDVLGAPVSCFAYPYGRFDQYSREIVRKHFACACSDKLALITEDSDPYALERVDAFYLKNNRLFDLIPTDLFPWYVKALSIPRRLRRAFQFGLKS